MGFLPEVKDYFKTIALSISLQSLSLLAIALPILPIFLLNFSTIYLYTLLLIILTLFGICNSIGNIPVMVLLQRMIPDNMRGRVFGLLTTFNHALVPVSMALVGYLLDIIPAHLLFITAGITMVPLLTVAFLNKDIKKINAYSRTG